MNRKSKNHKSPRSLYKVQTLPGAGRLWTFQQEAENHTALLNADWPLKEQTVNKEQAATP